MKRTVVVRYGVALLLGLAAAGSATVSIMVFGAAVFWLWVFGDDVWPSQAESALVIVAFAAGVATFGVTFWIVSRQR